MRQTDYQELGNEAVRICQELIRIPSVNHGSGVGDELAISDYVFDFLTRCGLKPIRYQAGENRVSVVARIIGRNPAKPGLVLHGHLDTVPANADDWQRDPWSGEIVDGEIWGRGAVDMKDMDAMILAIVYDWHQRAYAPAPTPDRDQISTHFTATLGILPPSHTL